MFQQKHNPSIVSTPEAEHQHSGDNVETVVGPSVKVEGDFASEGNIIVKGIVSGSVRTSQTLTVEKGAKIFANVKAENAVIAGGVKGNMKVVERIELSETAQIVGDIECKVLSMTPGALIFGKVTMKGLSLADEGERSEKKKFFNKVKSDLDSGAVSSEE